MPILILEHLRKYIQPGCLWLAACCLGYLPHTCTQTGSWQREAAATASRPPSQVASFAVIADYYLLKQKKN